MNVIKPRNLYSHILFIYFIPVKISSWICVSPNYFSRFRASHLMRDGLALSCV